MNDDLKILYDKISGDYDVGTYDEFSSKMSNEADARKFYDVVSKDYELGDYDAFINRIKKKDNGEATSQGSSATQSKSPSKEGVDLSYLQQETEPSSYQYGNQIKEPPNQEQPIVQGSILENIYSPSSTKKNPLQEENESDPLYYIKKPKFTDEVNNDDFEQKFPIENIYESLGGANIIMSDDEYQKKLLEIHNAKQQDLNQTWGTLGEFLEKAKVSTADIGYRGEQVNLDKNITNADVVKYGYILQQKQRVYMEQHPELFKGAFGQDIREDSYGLGTIRAVNEALTVPLLKTVDGIYNFVGNVMEAPVVGAKKILGKEAEFHRWKTPLVKSSADYIEEQSKQWQQLPNDWIGHTIEGTIGLSELLIELSATPQVKIANAYNTTKGFNALKSFGFINQEGAVVVPKLFTQMAGHNFFNDFTDAMDEGSKSPLLEGVKGAGVGIRDAAILTSLGFGTGKVGELMKSMGANNTVVTASKAVVGGGGFGGYSAISQSLGGYEIDPSKVIADVILGAGLELSHSTGRNRNLADVVAERAHLRYFSASPDIVQRARNTQQSPEALREAAFNLRKNIDKQTDINQKVGLKETSTMLDALADIKAIDSHVVKHADKYRDRIRKDDRIDDVQKEALQQRVDEAVNYDKINRSLNEGIDDVIQVNEVINKELKSGNKIVIPEESGLTIAGNLIATEKGFVMNSGFLKGGKAVIESKADVENTRKEMSSSEQAVREEIKKREEVDPDADYVIGSDVYRTKEEFLDAVGKMAKEGDFDMALFTSSDLRAKDTSFSEMAEVIEKNQAVSAGANAASNKRVTTAELNARIETFDRLNKRLDKADELLTKKKTDEKAVQTQQVPDGEKVQETAREEGEGKPAIQEEPIKASERPLEGLESTISPETTQSTTQPKEAVKSDISKQKEAKKETVSSIAAKAETGDFALSIDPKIENLKSELSKVKKEPKKIKSLIDGFLKANKKELDQADLNRADLAAINNARTWTQAGHAIKRLTKKIGLDTPKARAERLKNMIDLNKDSFKDVPSRVRTAIDKKVVDAYQSDAKYKQAVKYIDDVLNRQDFREYENNRLSAIDKINVVTSDKALLEKKGKKPKAKASIRTRYGDIENIDTLQAINDLVNNGGLKKVRGADELIAKHKKELEFLSKKDKPTLAEQARMSRLEHMNNLLELSKVDNIPERIEANENELERLRSGEKMTSEGIDREIELREQNNLLEFARINDLSLDRVREKLNQVNTIKEIQMKKAAIERDNRKNRINKIVDDTVNIITGGKGIPRYTIKKHARRKNKLSIPGESSFASLQNILAKRDLVISDNLPIFKDRLNEMTQPMVIKSERLLDEYKLEYYKVHDKIGEVFGKRSHSGRVSITTELSTPKKTGVDVYDGDGMRVYEIEASQAQLAEKYLQWKDPNGRASMEKPIEKGGMGWSEDVMRQIEERLDPRMKEVADWMADQVHYNWSELYDRAYIKENGISFKSNNPDYWPMSRRSFTVETGGLENTHVGSFIRSNRTMRRTGTTDPLDMTNIFDTYRQYVSEATRYAAFAETVRELKYIYKNPAVREAISQEHGTAHLKMMDEFINEFSGISQRASVDSIDKLMQNIGTGILGFKTRAPLKQLVSATYFSLDMPFYKLASGMSSMTPESKAVREFIKEQAFVKGRRSLSVVYGSDLEAYSQMAQVYGEPNMIKRVMSKIPRKEMENVSGWLLSQGDKLPIVRGGGAYLEHKYKQYSGRDITVNDINKARDGNPDPYIQRALFDWEYMSHLSQQSIRASNISYWRRSNSWGRALNAFTSGMTQVHRVAMSELRNLDKAVKNKNTKDIGKYSARFFGMWALSGLMFELVDQNFRPRSKDDLKDLGISMAMGATEGFAYYGRVLQFIKDKLEGEPWADAGLSVSPIIDNLEKLIASSIDFSQELAGVSDADRLKEHAAKVAVPLSILSGVPIDGAVKIYDGVSNVVKGESDQPFAEALGMERYSLNMANISSKQAIETLDHMMAFDNDGVFKMDENGIYEYAKTLTKLGKDADYYINKAYQNEVYQYMKDKFGYDMYSFEGIHKLLQRDDLTDAERGMLTKKMEELNELDKSVSYKDNLESIKNIIEKAQEFTGKPTQ